jgi:hypothetical protein
VSYGAIQLTVAVGPYVEAHGVPTGIGAPMGITMFDADERELEAPALFTARTTKE